VADLAKDIDDLELDDLEPGKSRRSAKATMERNHARQRESIERIKAKAIADGTMRADPELTVRHVDPETLRPKPPAPPPKRAKPLYDIKTTPKEEQMDADSPPRDVGRAAMDAAGLPDDPVPEPPAPRPAPSSESLRGRPAREREWQPPKREKVCKRCRLKFVPRSGNQRYCDRPECRTKECAREGCDNRFEINPAQPSQKFCSQECSQLALVKAPDSNPKEGSAGPPASSPAAPGAPAPPNGDISHSRAESAPEGARAHQERAAPAEPPARDSSPEEDDSALAEAFEAEDARYRDLLYRVVESPDGVFPVELRVRALELLHELWVERAGPPS
jgi:hypothetical protein